MFGIGRDPHEARTLEELILQKLGALSDHASDAQRAGAAATEAAGDRKAVLQRNRQFVRLQFAIPMRNYTRWGGWYGVAFTCLSLAALVSGLASSGIAAGWSQAGWARWTILLLGITAAASAVVIQVWKPGQKSASRTKGGNALRREAWDYLNDRGRYSDVKNSSEAFGLFADQVSAIVREAEEVDEMVPQAPSLGQQH